MDTTDWGQLDALQPSAYPLFYNDLYNLQGNPQHQMDCGRHINATSDGVDRVLSSGAGMEAFGGLN